MRSLILSAAFLSAAFMLGCQNQGLEPVGPEGLAPQFDARHGECEAHNKKNPGCGGGAEGIRVDVTLTGDIVSAGPQPARLVNDTKVKVEGFSQGSFRGELKLSAAAPDFAACTIENTSGGSDNILFSSLSAFLTKDINISETTAGEVNFQYVIKLKKQTGGLSLSWLELPDGPDIGKRIRVNVSSDNVTDLDRDQTRFTFMDGVVVVSRSIPGGTLTERDRLRCPYDGLNVLLVLNRDP